MSQQTLFLAEGSATNEISYTVGRNPIWNPEIQLKSRNPIWNPEIHTEIQKSNLKSGNPNLKMTQDTIKILRVYPYTLN